MARDKIHNLFKEALEDDGWMITDDPFTLRFKGTKLEIDLGAEKLIAASKGTEKILVEIKSMSAQSDVYEWHRAVGQHDHYIMALENQKSEQQLYIAVPNATYKEFFQTEFAKSSVKRNNIKLVVFDIPTKKIIKWTK